MTTIAPTEAGGTFLQTTRRFEEALGEPTSATRESTTAAVSDDGDVAELALQKLDDTARAQLATVELEKLRLSIRDEVTSVAPSTVAPPDVEDAAESFDRDAAALLQQQGEAPSVVDAFADRFDVLAQELRSLLDEASDGAANGSDATLLSLDLRQVTREQTAIQTDEGEIVRVRTSRLKLLVDEAPDSGGSEKAATPLEIPVDAEGSALRPPADADERLRNVQLFLQESEQIFIRTAEGTIKLETNSQSEFKGVLATSDDGDVRLLDVKIRDASNSKLSVRTDEVELTSRSSTRQSLRFQSLEGEETPVRDGDASAPRVAERDGTTRDQATSTADTPPTVTPAEVTGDDGAEIVDASDGGKDSDGDVSVPVTTSEAVTPTDRDRSPTAAFARFLERFTARVERRLALVARLLERFETRAEKLEDREDREPRSFDRRGVARGPFRRSGRAFDLDG